MLFGKRKKYHEEVVNTLFLIMPTINARDLKLFRVLLKFQIDTLYRSSAPPHMAAFSLAAFWYPEIMKNVQSGDVSFLRYLGPHTTGWLGACAKYIVEETSFLNERDSLELQKEISNWYNVPLPQDPRYSIGDLIDEHVRMKKLMP